MRTTRSGLASLALSAPLTLIACGGGGISGEYGGDECIFDKLDFRGGGEVIVTLVGVEHTGEYEVDGDEVTISSPNGQSVTYTRNGDALEVDIMGETMRCVKM